MYTSYFEGEGDHHKPQRFIYRNGMRIEEHEEDKIPKISRACMLIGNDSYKRNNLPNLTFTAYYRDILGEDEKSTTRFKKCNVIYYLEDDEIKIYEPAQKNSGSAQGCIVGKGRFEKPTGGYYQIDDLNIGNNLIIRGREYTLIDCDAFTKNFLREMGFRVKSPQPDIYDPITEERKEMNKLCSYRQPLEKRYPLASFLKNHPKCLRFFGCYGEGKNLFEYKRYVTLYYDLSNGRIKLVEEKVDDKNATCVLLRPTLVPKEIGSPLLIGAMGDQPPLLNFAHDVRNVMIGGQYYKIQNSSSRLVDSNPVGASGENVDYFTDKDLELGKPFNIFCTTVFLYDCDEFTRIYYRSTYNKELVPVPRPNPKLYQTHKLVYKHEEFGQPEQTLRTNDPFKPKTCHTDLLKFLKTDRYGYDMKQLKFLARIATDNPMEKLQKFTVYYFMEDDTMMIRLMEYDNLNQFSMELPYLRRMKFTKPQSAYENSGRSFYQVTDMFVGNVIYVRGKAFELIEADEYTFDYMEKHSNVFPFSNIKLLMSSLQNWIKSTCDCLKSCFEERDKEKTELISYEDFKTIMLNEIPEEMKNSFPEHAIKTIARYYAEDEYIGLRLEDIITKVKTELYRKKYYDFDDLKIALSEHDNEKSGLLNADRIYFIFRTASVPIDRDLIKSLLFKFPKIDCKVNYNDLVESINWITNSVPRNATDINMIQINWQRIESTKNLNKIKYKCFIMDALSS